MSHRFLLVATFAAAFAFGFAPRKAGATVCNIDPTPLVAVPVSASMHLGSLLPASIGLGLSDGQRGWKTTAFITAPINYLGSASILIADGLSEASCGGGDGVGPLHPATLAVEGTMFAWTTALLVAAIAIDDPSPPVMGYVVPAPNGVAFGLGGIF